MSRLKSLVAALLVALPAPDAGGQEGGDASSKAWFGLPVLFYLPETSMGFGAIGGVHLIRPGTRTSSIELDAVYTLERQFSADAMLQLFDQERNALMVTAVASRLPYRDYGTGPSAPRSAEERYTTRYAELLVTRQWAFGSALRIGPRLHLRAEELVDAEAGGRIATGTLRFRGYRAAGLGASLTWDDRDDPFWPTRGTWVEAWALGYGGHGAGPFLRGSGAARRFLPLGGGQVLGLEARLDLAGGDVPFTLLPRLGGPRGVRGYYEGRWRDRWLWSGQAEGRFPVAWRLQGTAFAGVAGVAPSLPRLGDSRPRPAGGLGLRVRLTRTGLHLRLDLAAGQDGPAGYVTLGEAF